MNRAEQKLQTAVVVALRRHFDCLPYHVPNGGARTRLEALAFRDAGATAGVPDLVVPGREGRTLYLELKAGVQARERDVAPSARIHSADPAQKRFIADLRERGFRVAIIDSVEEALAEAEAFGLGPRRKPVRSEAALSTGF